MNVCAFADVVLLKNGQRLEGLIHKVPERNQIELHVPGSTITLNEADITTYTLASKALNFIISSEIALADRQLPAAWQYYIYAMDEGAPLKLLKSSLLKHRDLVFPLEIDRHPEWRTAALAFCRAVRRYGQTEDDLLALSAKMQFLLDDYQGALETYNFVSQYYYQANPAEKQFVVGLIQKEIGEDIALGRFQDALRKAEVFASIEPSVAEACKILAYLNWAGENKRAGQFEDALRICRDQIYPIAPLIARDRVVSILEMLKAQARQTGEIKPVLELAQLYARVVAPEETRTMINALVEQAAEEALAQGDWRKAGEYLTYPDEESLQGALANLVDRVEFQRRRQSLAADQYREFFLLGEWALGRGLLHEAIQAYEQAAQGESFREDAQLQVNLLRRQVQTDEFRQILAIYESGDYMSALERGQAYLNQYDDPVYRSETEQLMDIARERLASEAGKRPVKAEIEYQQAERAYLLSEFTEALKHVDVIERQYSDTPAAEKALALRVKILRAMDMARIESFHRNTQLTQTPLDQLPPAPSSEKTADLQDELRSILDALAGFSKHEQN